VVFLQCLTLISLRLYIVFVQYVTAFVHTVLCLSPPMVSPPYRGGGV
jgi:hypothetical protein